MVLLGYGNCHTDAMSLLQVNAGFIRLAHYNAKEWPYFILGSFGSGLLGLVMPFFALVRSPQLTVTAQWPASLCVGSATHFLWAH